MTAAQAALVRDALLDHGVPLVLCDGPLGRWDVCGDDWQEGKPTGVIQHNTATASAVGPTGRPSLEWLLNPGYSKPAANLLTARGTPTMEGVKPLGGSPTAALTFAACLRSALHCGRGGPWPLTSAAQDVGHRTLLGVEHDARQVGPGELGALTDPQIEAGARIGAAVADLWGGDVNRIATHTAWCDGSHLGADGSNLGPYTATLGRKDDTWGDAWANRNNGPSAFNTLWWREQARKFLSKPIPQGDQKMVVIQYGVSRFRLIGGGDNKMKGISAMTADILKRGGVPVVTVNDVEWAALSSDLGSV